MSWQPECCMMLWIIWMNVILTLLSKVFFEYWLQLDPADNKAFVLDVTDTYYNGKHDLSTQRKGKDGKVSKLIQIGLVSFGNGFPIFYKSYNGNISNIKFLRT